MSWRTVVITNHAKLSYKNGYMIVKGIENHLIHLSEIGTVLIDSTMVTVSSHLICELLKKKVKIIFTDEKRNPMSEVVPYYGCHDTSKKIHQQLDWNKHFQQFIWTEIIRQKIINQSILLKKVGCETYHKLDEYANQVEFFDSSNREGHAAKVYFNSLYGKGFIRGENDIVNAGLNYGYTILLSTFNKEIVSNGYLTQLGIKHSNIFNPFNLSSDLMEPFRVLVDEVVYGMKEELFDKLFKLELIDILNQKVYYDEKEHYVGNAISLYIKNIFEVANTQEIEKLVLFRFE